MPRTQNNMDHVHQNTPAELDLLEFHCNINQTLQARLTFEKVIRSCILSNEKAAVWLSHRQGTITTRCTLTGRRCVCCSQNSPGSSMVEMSSPTARNTVFRQSRRHCIYCYLLLFLLKQYKQYNCHLLMSSASLGYLRFKPTVQPPTHSRPTRKQKRNAHTM